MTCLKLKAKTHDEWLKNREGGIGASEVGTIMNCNPYQTRYQLWARKKGLMVQEENEAMLLGHLFENAVAQRYAIATGNNIVKASASEDVYMCAEKPWMRVSPDRLYVKKGERKIAKNYRLLECKTAGRNAISEDNIPLSYYCQVQYQMHVMGIHNATLAWINLADRTFGFKDFTYDAEFCKVLEAEVEKFWHENIEGNIEPEATTTTDCMLKYPKSIEGSQKEASDEEVQMAQELAEIKKEIKLFESSEAYVSLLTREKDLTEKIKVAMGGNENLVSNGSLLITYKTAKSKQVFDDKTALAEHPELLKYVSEKVGNRTLLVKVK